MNIHLCFVRHSLIAGIDSLSHEFLQWTVDGACTETMIISQKTSITIIKLWVNGIVLKFLCMTFATGFGV